MLHFNFHKRNLEKAMFDKVTLEVSGPSSAAFTISKPDTALTLQFIFVQLRRVGTAGARARMIYCVVINGPHGK